MSQAFIPAFRALSRARWTVMDQGISSASNLLFVVTVARTSTVAEFGTFSLSYLAYGLLLGIGRAIGGDILLLRAEQQPEERERDERRLLGLILTLGAAGAVAACSIAALAGGSFGTTLFAFGAMLPILLMQDALRYCLFARRIPALAAANDLIWLAVQVVVTLALLRVMPQAGPALLVLAWAAGAAAALGIGLWQVRLTPTLRKVSAWFAEDRARVSSFFGDFAMQSGSTYAWGYLIAVLGRVEDVAAVRGGLLLFAPLDALFLSVRVVTLPSLARYATVGSSSLRRQARLIAALSAAVATTWAAVALSLPHEVGRAALGATWDVVTPIVIPLALASVSRYVSMAPQTGLWALGDARSIVSLRVTVTLIILGSVTVGTSVAGALGAAMGLAVANVTQCILWWRGFLASCRRMSAGSSAQSRNRSVRG
jgi:O-antigen/teichoic acid export membrane protein